MPAPATNEQLLELIRKSALVEPDRLDSFAAGLRVERDAPTAPAALAKRMIADGLITNFQSEQFLLGKWRGFTIGKYRVLERLGAGGMGSVYLCEHLKMRHKVAVKVLPTTKATDPAALGRFYREARASGVLDHPNLVRAHDIDQEGELHYLVLDFVDGVNLQHLVTRRTGPLTVERACHYIFQAAAGLEHAFEKGLVHRDIKPANLLLDRFGVIRVLDMGLARFFHDNQDNLTLKYDDHNVLGTADYVSPEQAMDSHDVDVRTDIYSLGATFYFLLAGRPLFPEGRIAQKLVWHQTKEPMSIRLLRPDVPAGLAAVIDKMLAKAPADRYQTPAELMAALEPWVQTAIPPPIEAEIPTLSPAARRAGTGDSSGSRSPSSRTPARARVAVSAGSDRRAAEGSWGKRSNPNLGHHHAASASAAVDDTPRALASEVQTIVAQQPVPVAQLVPPTGSETRSSGWRRALFVALLIGSVGAGIGLRLAAAPRDQQTESRERTPARDAGEDEEGPSRP